MKNENLQNKASLYRQSPPDDTWQKLDYVLLSRSSKKQKSAIRIRLMSYAAILLILVSFVLIFNTDKNQMQHTPLFEAAAQNEEISPIYSNTQMDGLRKAYAKVFPEQNKGL